MNYRYREAHEMKDSGVEWLGMIPKGWEKKKLKYIFNKIQTGTTPSTANKKYFDGEICWFNPKDLNKEILLKSEKTVTKLAIEKNEAKIFPEDSILIVGIGATAGKTSYLKQKATFNQQITGFKSYKNVNKFYFYCMKNISSELLKVAKFTTLPILNNEFFKSLDLVEMSSDEQQKIASFLDKKTAEFDSIIAKKQAFIDKLTEAKKSLISEVVTGKLKIQVENNKYKVKNREPHEMKDSGVQWLGMIPKEWEVKRLKYILSERKLRSTEGTEIPLSMSQKYGLIRTSEMPSIPNQSYNLIGNKICYENDLVFNKLKAHLGVFSVAREKGLVSPDYAVYYSNQGQTSIKYYEYLFKTRMYINEFKKYSYGVGEGLTRLYTEGLFGIMALYPSKEEQDTISNFINEKTVKIDSTIEKIKVQIEKLKEAKQSLISEAVTGKIEIID